MRIALLGDIALIGKYDTKNTADWKERLRAVKEYLSGFDYVIANLESPLTTCKKTIIPKSMHLRSDISNVVVLKYLGINAVTLANNHIFDFGEQGLRQTIEVLEENQIEWYGAFGKDLSVKDGETVINISGFCCLTTAGAGLKKTNGVNLLCMDSIRQQIEKDKSMGAYSIISIHWGHVNCSLPSPEQINIAHKIFKLKENVVIHGHHAHCIEGVEPQKHGIVAYSMGDFIFDTCVSIDGKFMIKQIEKNLHSFVLSVTIADGVYQGYNLYPLCDTEGGILPKDKQGYIENISAQIAMHDSAAYQEMRLREFVHDRDERAGKHDWKWLRSRLNYYSVFAKILSWQNDYKYKKIIRDFQK
ncbi:MAG: CapA family protein [Clostridiales bacterium]|nr:CapA family protein [Clostridiales bacterium]